MWYETFRDERFFIRDADDNETALDVSVCICRDHGGYLSATPDTVSWDGGPALKPTGMLEKIVRDLVSQRFTDSVLDDIADEEGLAMCDDTPTGDYLRATFL